MVAKTITREEFDQVKDDVEKHEHWIYGNAEPGAKTEICLMKDQLSRINRGVTAVITASITLIVSLLIWLFTDVIPRAIGK
ncbi:MAG: hypothetical protein M0R06_08355 [Sphaerochaeta sp.]|nr:hypothetical protein [Sphaerochaeta sp.]